MFQVTKYSFANAKVRALLSYVLEPGVFSQMLEAKNIGEAVSVLAQTRYQSLLDIRDPKAADLHSIEKALIRNDIAMHSKVVSSLTSKEGAFLYLFLQRYEIEELKVVLRLWHKKFSVDWRDHVSGLKICFDLNYDQIISAGSVDEISHILRKTPYGAALLRGRDKFRKTNSLFFLETALDIDYYERVALAMEKLSSRDKVIARRIVGVEIDMENITWLIRMRKYYTVAMGEMLEWMIPGGLEITKDALRRAYISDGVTKLADSLALGPYEKIKDMVEDNIFLIENFLYGILLKEVRKAFAGFPFTAGVPMGYLILKRKETQKIISILYAKSYGWEKEQITNLIIV